MSVPPTRRSFIVSLGLAGTMGALTAADRGDRTPRVRIWLSEEAAQHGVAVGENLRSYLHYVMSEVYDETDVSIGGVVDVPTEDGYEVFLGPGGWGRLVTEGFLDSGEIRAVDGVNLLVTDGSMRTAPTGGAMRGAASVGGASYLTDIPPIKNFTGTIPFSYPYFVLQVVIHECGHALGLGHDHGGIIVDGDRAIVTPMVSSYAWASEWIRNRQFDFYHSACGKPYPTVAGKRRYLNLSFSQCATNRLRCWGDGILASNGLYGCCTPCQNAGIDGETR